MSQKVTLSRTEIFLLHIDKKLSKPNTELINQHLNKCNNCRQYYQDVKEFYRNDSIPITKLVFAEKIEGIRDRLFDNALFYLSDLNEEVNQEEFDSSQSMSFEIEYPIC